MLSSVRPPLAPQLSDVSLRLDRAKEHLSVLGTEVEGLLQTKPYGSPVKRDAVPHRVTGALRRPIRQRPRLIVAHQPRSSSRVRNALSSGAGESVDRGSRLFEFLPVRPPEEPGESGTEGRTFVVFRVEVKNRGSVRCR